MPSDIQPAPSPADRRVARVRSAASGASIRLTIAAAVAAAAVLGPLTVLANAHVADSVRARADTRIQAAAQRYAALVQAAVNSRAEPLPAVAADSTLRTMIQAIVATSAAGDVAVELTDSTGRLIAESRSPTSGDVQAFATAARSGTDSVFTFVTSQGPELAALATTDFARWSVVAHEPVSAADRTYREIRDLILGFAIVLWVIAIGVAAVVDRLVGQRIRRPARELAGVAEAVAGGDLTIRVPTARSTEEIGRLGRALAAMVAELARLARVLNESASDTATMSAQITASSEQMSGSAAQIAQTASELSRQSTEMAESIQVLAVSADTLRPLAARLQSGAEEGVARNTRLRGLATENRQRMDASTEALATLTGDVEATSAAVRALVDGSQEIRTFVSLVQSLARHSKLLALNAAMEAARAGDQGEGFSVVAAEVRRLSAMSSEAAGRTQQVVADVLGSVERSSENMERMALTARQVRRATELASESFAQLEGNVGELDAWVASIEAAATTTNDLVARMTERLDAVARGTESFAAAMQQVAAASEEQSASTEEIAAAAASMAHAAERLARLVANLQTGERAPERAARR